MNRSDTYLVILTLQQEEHRGCGISLEYMCEDSLRTKIDELRPVLHPRTRITVYHAESDEPIIEDEFRSMNGEIVLTEKLRKKIEATRTLYREAYGLEIGADDLIEAAMTIYRSNLTDVADTRRRQDRHSKVQCRSMT